MYIIFLLKVLRDDKNIKKCVGTRKDLYFLGFIFYLFLTYVYVSSLMLSLEDMYGTRN